MTEWRVFFLLEYRGGRENNVSNEEKRNYLAVVTDYS